MTGGTGGRRRKQKKMTQAFLQASTSEGLSRRFMAVAAPSAIPVAVAIAIASSWRAAIAL